MLTKYTFLELVHVCIQIRKMETLKEVSPENQTRIIEAAKRFCADLKDISPYFPQLPGSMGAESLES